MDGYSHAKALGELSSDPASGDHQEDGSGTVTGSKRAKPDSDYLARGKEKLQQQASALDTFDYRQAMEARNLENEKIELEKKLAAAKAAGSSEMLPPPPAVAGGGAAARKKRRWDDAAPALTEDSDISESVEEMKKKPASSRWDQTPQQAQLESGIAAPPEVPQKKSRWDKKTPIPFPPPPLPPVAATVPAADGAASAAAAEASSSNIMVQVNPQARWQKELAELNRPLSDAELDAMMPAEGYEICQPPPGYSSSSSKSQALLAAPEGDIGKSEVRNAFSFY